MNLKTTICFLFLLIAFHAGTSYAAQVAHECAADRFVKCPSFRMSRTIGEHTPIIDNHLAGFTRSKGRWTITVGYGPPEKCAKVSLLVNMGPIDSIRKYERVFVNGGGAISDSGSFMHKIDDLESALRIVSSDCRVPAPGSRQTDAEKKERQALDEERERQELEEERERQALEEERERLALEEERRRLEEEQRLVEQRRERERQRLAEERREREQRRLAEERRERERRRLAEERRERERRRLAAERRERERKRLARQRREQERRRAQRQSEADAAAALAVIGGFLQGLAGGSGGSSFGGIARGPGGGGCTPLPSRCSRASNRARSQISSLRARGNSGVAQNQYCAYVYGIRSNEICAREYRSMGKYSCADRSQRQADAYRRALPRLRSIHSRTSSAGARLSCN